jgi:NADPH2:quinone reductase
MINAIRFYAHGGAQVLKFEPVDLPPPAAGEVRLRHTAIGLNYIDIYHRNGLYPVSLPAIPGLEAAGQIEAVGEGVKNFKVGDRVAYGRGPLGAYTEARNIAAKELIALPEGVSDEVAAASMLKGLTAWYLLHQTFPVNKGDTLLIHAAAGGVGLIMVQWAKKLGARVIATVGSEEKAALVKEHGADQVILYRTEPVAPKVKMLTDGKGVDVVYDAVGKATFMASLDSLKPQGLMVSYGQASGPVPTFDISELSKRGSLYLTRPNLTDYMKRDATYREAAKALLDRIAAGDIKIHVAQKLPLKEAAKAQIALETRETVGATVLVP